MRNKRGFYAALPLLLVVGLLAGLRSAPAYAAEGECPAGTQWLDDNGNGVVEPSECVVVIVDPDLRGEVKVKAGCGFLRVINREETPMRFSYGRSHGKLRYKVTVAPGANKKVNVPWRSVDWKATWRDKDPRVGHGLRVRQGCSSRAAQPHSLPKTGG